MQLDLRLGAGRSSGSGVGVSLCFAGVSWDELGLGVLVVFLCCAVDTCSSRRLGFWKQTDHHSVFLTVVLSQTVGLGALLAFVVGPMVAKNGSKVTVLRPGKFRLGGLAVFLQELVDRQGWLLQDQAALVVGTRIHQAVMILFCEAIYLCG